MLEDRPYMGNTDYRTRVAYPATIVLIAINLAVFILVEINKAYGSFPVLQFFALSPAGLRHGYIWQLLSFQFLHFDAWHFVFNMLALYLFGRSVEESIGRRRFLTIYFASGVAGGLLQSLLGFLLPGYFGYPVVGASAGVAGIIAVFATLDPNKEILLFLVLPLRAKYALWAMLAISIFYVVVPAGRGIAHAAHLGGILAGIACTRWIIKSTATSRDSWGFNEEKKSRPLVKVRFPKPSSWKKAEKSKPSKPGYASTTEFISHEVDPILDKISAHGIQSLTPRERKILEAAREKMDRR